MLSKKQMDLFSVLKLNTSYIMSNNCDITLTYQAAKRDNMIVSLGDNQLLRFIRRVKEREYDKDYVSSLYDKRNELKAMEETKENSKEIINLQNQIDEYLFVPDLIVIKTDTTKKDYKYICKNRITITTKINRKQFTYRYRRLCAGAGQLRRNSAMFINEEIFDEIEAILMCGLNRKKIGKINLSKFGAYFALYTSASRRVTTPNVCVVKDLEFDLKDQNLLWISDDENGDKQIEPKVMDMNINAFDGSGMISPRMAEKWSRDLKLDYIPASFILRAPFVKGLVSVFNFHKFAKEVAHKDTIVDYWGNEHKVEDIDVILTTSQFKMY